MTRLLFAVYLIEAGLVLVVAPWTAFWDRNYFATLLPWLRAWLEHPALRGTVTAVGLVTGVAGVGELTSVVVARARARLVASGARPPEP